jgi:hypothetical protein
MKRLLILLILIIIVTISGCVGQTGLENVGMKITTDECPKEAIKNFLNSAIENDSLHMPSLHYWNYNTTGDVVYYQSSEGKIGDWNLCDYLGAICYRGSKEGENLNYYYCVSTQQPYIFCSKKTIVKSDGTIEKIDIKCVNNFVINNDRKVIDVICSKDIPQNTGC